MFAVRRSGGSVAGTDPRPRHPRPSPITMCLPPAHRAHGNARAHHPAVPRRPGRQPDTSSGPRRGAQGRGGGQSSARGAAPHPGGGHTGGGADAGAHRAALHHRRRVQPHLVAARFPSEARQRHAGAVPDRRALPHRQGRDGAVAGLAHCHRQARPAAAHLRGRLRVPEVGCQGDAEGDGAVPHRAALPRRAAGGGRGGVSRYCGVLRGSRRPSTAPRSPTSLPPAAAICRSTR